MVRVVIRISRQGFTLIEMMVVVVIILTLCSLIIPALASARESARAVKCSSHMRQWGQALQVYTIEQGRRLPREGQSSKPDMSDAWYNQLPPLVGAPAYMEIYDGDPVEVEGGYDHGWIWYCPTKLRYEEKNSGSTKNSFHYGMHAVLNGTKRYGPDYGDINNQKFTRLNRIFDMSSTVFLAEGNNQPMVTPHETKYYPKLDRQRNLIISCYVVFLDVHFRLLQGRDVREPRFERQVSAGGVWATQSPRIIWGPFEN